MKKYEEVNVKNLKKEGFQSKFREMKYDEILDEIERV